MPFICLSNFVKLDVKCLFLSNTAVDIPCTVAQLMYIQAHSLHSLQVYFILYGKIEFIIYTQQE